MTLEQNIHTTLESDLPAIHQSLNGSSIRKIEKLLSIIASLVPFTPDMIYLNNPNLYHALSRTRDPDVGAMRETFFVNMLRTAHTVSVPAKGDFLVDDSVTFEVGGKNKDAGQIRGVENFWLALDGIETGHGRRIPLWLFGFVY